MNFHNQYSHISTDNLISPIIYIELIFIICETVATLVFQNVLLTFLIHEKTVIAKTCLR